MSGNTWVVTADERQKHETTFLSLKPSNGRLTGEQAKKFFLSSNLPPATLGQIWNLSDLDKDGQMTQQEFAIAMHLIQCKLKGINLPTSLPLSLKTSSRGSTGASLLNPVENGFQNQTSNQNTGWSSTLTTGPQSQPATGWSVGIAPSLPAPLLPVNNQMQTSAAPATSRLLTPSSQNFTPSFGMPTPNGLGMSSMSMAMPMPSVNSAMPPMTNPVSNMSGVGQSMRQQPVARVGSFTNMTPQPIPSGEVSITAIPPNSRLKFNQLFKANDYEKTGFLTGEQARSIFLQSHLPPQILAQIWDLSDVDKDGQLSMEEFAIGMHLVESAKSGKPLPSVLPKVLLPQQYKKTLSESIESESMEGLPGGQIVRQRSVSSSSANDDMTFFRTDTFEDKRKQNFERGRLELERRRQEMEEQRKKQKEEQERKERLEEERKQRAKIEAEQKRQIEIEKQRKQQEEMEREQEALRKKMIQQRLQAQIEAERQRQLEWEKRKKEELLNHKSLEKDIVTGLQVRKDKMVLERENLEKKMESLREDLKKQKTFYAEYLAATDALIKSRERKIAEIADIENKRKLCKQQLPGLSSEQDRLQRELHKRESSIMDEAYGNVLSSIEDTTCGIRRQVSNKNNLTSELETKRKMMIQLNDHLRQIRALLQNQMDENNSLRQALEVKKNEYQAMKVKQEEERKKKQEEEVRLKREAEQKRKKEEEERKQKEREMEAMRLERERQRQEQERRQKLQQQKMEEEKLRRLKEQQKLELEKKQKEQQRIEEEKRRKSEEQQRLEERQKQEQQRLEEERQRQEQQRLEKERQRKLQEANEAKKQVQLRQEDLVNKDKVVQEQATMLAKPRKPTKPAPYNKADKEAEVRKKVQEMQRLRNEQKKEKEAAPAPPTSEAFRKKKEFYKVLYSFSPRNPDELALNEGDQVAVFPEKPKVPPGWLFGSCKEKEGLFPENYTEKLPESKGDCVELNPSNSSQPFTATGSGRSVSSIIAALNNQKDLPIAMPVVTKEEELEKKSTNQIPAPTPTNQNSTVFPDGLQAVALYQHRGKSEDELSFNKNDIITLKEQKDMSWFGEFNGKTGWFPKSYAKLVRGQRRGEGSTSDTPVDSNKSSVQIPSRGSSAFKEVTESRPSEPAIIGECVALYTYNGEAGDLSFQEGDVISITKSDGDWWEGTLNGQKGIFPANYVTMKEAEVQKSSTKRPEIATVTTAYTATSPDQLSLVPGQYIAVKTKNSNGWWEGQLQARGKKRQSGLFPANCVKLLSSGGNAAPANNDSLKANDGASRATSGPSTPQDDMIYAVPSSNKPAETLDQVLAMFSYTAQNSDELTFYKGSVITVLNREGEWWQGELNGQVGVFPNNYVQPLADLPTTTQWTGTWDRKLLDSMTSMERNRQNCIYEIINSEQTYVDDMSLTLEVFYNPIATSNLLDENELNTIFVNWRELIFCSTKLLKAFLVRRKTNNEGQIYVIGDVLCEQLPRLTPYIRFCSCQLKACKLLQNKIENVPEFKALEKKCCQDPRARGLPLSSYLLKPLQRVTKYPLLIRKILEDTPGNHSDRGDLEIALEKAEDLCRQVNEGVRSQEDTDRLEFMQTHISTEGLDERLIFNSQTNCLGQRKFVYEGTLFKHKSGKELQAFLCNDFLLLTRENTSLAKKIGKDSEKQYVMYQPPIRLNEITVKVPDQNTEETFQVSHIDRVYLLRAETKNERITWVRKLKQASEQYIETERLQRQKAHRARSFRSDNIGKLMVLIIEGSDLKASDPNGLSDPYCEVSLGGQEHKTKVITNSLHPKWNSSMTFSLRDIKQDVLCISVFDQDMYSPNDFLGRTEVPLAKLLKEGKGPWEKRLLLHEVSTGELLVRLELQFYKTK